MFKTVEYSEPEAYSKCHESPQNNLQRTLHNLGAFKNLVYLEPQHIQNPRDIKNPVTLYLQPGAFGHNQAYLKII